MDLLKKGKDELGYLDTLTAIFRFESKRVAGPGSYRKDIRDTLWTLDEFMNDPAAQGIDRKDVIRLLKKMAKNRELMVVDGPRYTTRVAETIRLLGHSYEYWYKGRPGVDALRWVVEEKKVPSRTIPAEEFISKLQDAIMKKLVPNTHRNLPQVIHDVVKGIADYVTGKRDWTEACFSEFQYDSSLEMLKAQYMDRYPKHSQILTAGVGTGKTIAFLIAIFVSALDSIRENLDDTRTHLLLYPRTALAKDQHMTVYKMAEEINKNIRVHFDHASHYKSMGLSVKNGIQKEYGSRYPPHIIITTLETLKRRLQNPVFVHCLTGCIRRVVLDEIHLVQGMTGSHVIGLIRRLKAINDRKLILWTGSSATVAAPDEHAHMVFSVPKRSVKVIFPQDEELTSYGIANHVFLRPSPLMSSMGTLVNSTSLLVHSRRDRIHNLHSSTNAKNNPKTIGFADDLDLLGRWNSDLKENERTEEAMDRKHPQGRDTEKWKKPREREIPYALRYIKPLTRRIEAKEGVGKEEDTFAPVFQHLIEQDPCKECRNGRKIKPISCTEEDLLKLARFVQRDPTRVSDPAKKFHIRSSAFLGAREINTLEECPYLQAGACIWFADDDFKADEIRGTGFFEYRNVIRSRIYSSKTKSLDTVDEDLSSTVFMGSTREIYDVPKNRDGSSIPCDVVLSSPSLEVGIDLSNVTESIMFRAIRNVASYRQKAGRTGREQGRITINVSLMSQSPIDSHYYRQPKKLTSIAQMDPVPLENKNQAIMKSTLYCAIWDYLASSKSVYLPEIIPYDGFSKCLKDCIRELKRKRTGVGYHLSFVSGNRFSHDSVEIQTAIDVAINELEFLTLSVKGLFKPNTIEILGDVIPSYLSRHLPSAGLLSFANRPFNDIKLGQKNYWEHRPYISPIGLELEEEFLSLDKMGRCGWDGKEVSRIKDILNAKRVNGIMDDRMKEDLRRTVNSLEAIEFGIQSLEKSGFDPKIVSFFHQFLKLYNHQIAKAHYLSFILQDLPVFRLFRDDLSYVSPENLFSSPYDNDVNVIFTRWGSDKDPVWVPLTEVLFSLIPGTWSFRWGVNPYKSLVGKLEHEPGDTLRATYDLMSSEGCIFIPEKMDVKSPIGEEGETIGIYRPIQLVAKRTGKYQRCRVDTGLVVDGDECERGKSSSDKDSKLPKIKIPKSYTTRWVDIDTSKGESIQCYESEDEENELRILDGSNILTGSDVRNSIKHPLLNGLLESVEWHENLEATDFVYSVMRSYSKPQIRSQTIVFDKDGQRIGFGRSLTTRGVSLNLDPATFKDVVTRIIDAIVSNERIWIPTAFKALSASLVEMKLDGEIRLNRFIVRDLLAILLISVYPDFDNLESGNLHSVLIDLIRNEEKFRKAAYQYYKSRTVQDIQIHDVDDPDSDESDEEVNSHVSNLTRAIEGIESGLVNLQEDFRKYLEYWLERTLLNSVGSAAVTALRKLSGITSHDVGYSFGIEREPERRYRVYLFDSDQYGNGSCKVLEEFFHILHIQRYADTRRTHLLPTYDYATLFEEELLQCSQFHQDINALMQFEHNKGGRCSYGYPELDYLRDYSEEVVRVSADTWSILNISGRRDAWKLPIINIIAGYVAQKHENLESDDIIRATGICWNGCPECSDTAGGAMRAIAGDAFMDKFVLDEWFEFGRKKANEYKTTRLAELKGNRSIIEIGTKSKLGLRKDDIFIRSVALPHTIGLEINRLRLEEPVSIVIRDNDVTGLSTETDRARTSWHGIPGQAFRRLVWYNLLTTAFLDSMGILEETEKEIWFLYFNIRDLDFVDVGMTGRAMEIIEHYHEKNVNTGPIEKLSDVLLWLSNRGFRIKLCVSKMQVEEENDPKFRNQVVNLLAKLSDVKGIEVLTKEVKGGIMHKKGLMTSIGIISGSANLTFRASTSNEEDLSYFLPADNGYNDLKLSFEDTLQLAEEWRE